MLKYKIEVEGKDNRLPVVTFEDKAYELAATFLLSEARNIDALEEVCEGEKQRGSFAGNVFSLEITPETTTICDDISGKECEIGTQDLKEIAEEYCTVYNSL